MTSYSSATETADITVTGVNDAPTFNVTEGYSAALAPSGIAYAEGATTDTDGKTLVVGRGGDGIAVARFNTDGSLDTSFGNGGSVDLDFGLSSVAGNSIAVQADGKLIVTGTYNNGSDFDFVVARLNADGTLDTTFDGDGFQTIDLFGENDFSPEVVVQTDGKVLLAGKTDNAGNDEFAFVRLDSDGSFDNTFGTNGITSHAASSGNHSLEAVALQADGKLVFGGSAFGNANTFTVSRINANGTLDATFGGTGIVQTDLGTGSGQVYDLTIQSDGKVVATGADFSSAMVVVRYEANGTLDTGFNTTGILTTTAGGVNGGEAVAVQSDGKIVVAAEGSSSADVVLRFNANGSVDDTFGTNGVAVLQAPDSDDAYDLLDLNIGAGGEIIVAGSNGDNFVVEQLSSSGESDRTFGYSSLDNVVTYVEDGAAVTLDADVEIFRC